MPDFIRSNLTILTLITWLTGGLPLLIYPIVLLAGVMSLAGETTGDEPALLMAVARVFLIGSLVYPLIYAGSLVGAICVQLAGGGGHARLGAALVPLAYLLALIMLMGVWAIVEQLSI